MSNNLKTLCIATRRVVFDGALWWRAYDTENEYLYSWGRSKHEAVRMFNKEHPIWLRYHMAMTERDT